MAATAFIIDAAGRAPGRIASEVSLLLRGKNDPSFAPHVLSQNRVRIINASKMKFTGKKLEKNLVSSHSGYPGGLKQIPLKMVVAKDVARVLRASISKMLPKNRQRKELMKHLTIEV